MNNWILYLDESGNTGINFADPDQPIFVYGGWLVKSENRTNVENYINNCFKKCKARELKFPIIKRRYSNDLYNFLSDSINNEMFPFFIAMNKTHILLAHIIELFFDYAYNTTVNSETTFDYSYKRELVDKLYGNSKLYELIVASIKNRMLDIFSLRELCRF